VQAPQHQQAHPTQGQSSTPTLPPPTEAAPLADRDYVSPDDGQPNEEEDDIQLSDESVATIKEASRVLDSLPPNVQIPFQAAIANLIKDARKTKSESGAAMRELTDLRKKYDALRDGQEKDTTSVFSDLLKWVNKHEKVDPSVENDVAEAIKNMPPPDQKKFQVLFRSIRAAGSSADNSRHISETDEFINNRETARLRAAKGVIDNVLGKRTSSSSGLNTRFETPAQTQHQTNANQSAGNSDVKKRKKENYKELLHTLKTKYNNPMSEDDTKKLKERLAACGNAFTE
jgi:hypothetical protein